MPKYICTREMTDKTGRVFYDGSGRSAPTVVSCVSSLMASTLLYGKLSQVEGGKRKLAHFRLATTAEQATLGSIPYPPIIA
jgi:hypothetical protein